MFSIRSVHINVLLRYYRQFIVNLKGQILKSVPKVLSVTRFQRITFVIFNLFPWNFFCLKETKNCQAMNENKKMKAQFFSKKNEEEAKRFFFFQLYDHQIHTTHSWTPGKMIPQIWKNFNRYKGRYDPFCVVSSGYCCVWKTP